MSAALNSLVKAYLDGVHPKAAKALAKEAPLDDAQRRKSYGSQSIEALVLRHAKTRPLVNDDDDAPPRKAAKTSPKAVPRKAPIPEFSSDDDDDDDEAPVRKPTMKKVTPKSSPRLASKKAPVPDSSDDDEEDRTAFPKPVLRKDSAKQLPKKAPAVLDSSDSEGEVPTRRPATKSASPKASPKAVTDSSSDDDAPTAPRRPAAHHSKNSEANAPVAVKGATSHSSNGSSQSPSAHAAAQNGGEPSARKGPDNRNADGTYKRFQRIDPSKVKFTSDALRDNRPGQEHLVLRQNQEMMRVKGKDFNKLKQKNKGKFYGAGVDLTVRSYQFPDSDDD